MWRAAKKAVLRSYAAIRQYATTFGEQARHAFVGSATSNARSGAAIATPLRSRTHTIEVVR
jgi:hypothetical protein